MKKLLLGALVAFSIFSCNQPQKPPAQSTSSAADSANVAASKAEANMKALYQKNLTTLKAVIAGFENKSLDPWNSSVADNVAWHSPAYGDMDSSKTHWKDVLNMYFTNWDSLKLKNAIYLPGVDAQTQMLDGSVRVYGDWYAIYKKTGKKTVGNKFYGTYDFDKDGKISNADEYHDVGGLMKAFNIK